MSCENRVILTRPIWVKVKPAFEGHIGDMDENDGAGIGPNGPVPQGLRSAAARRQARLGRCTASPCAGLNAGSTRRSQTELTLFSQEML